jgi:hypothetical protein
MLIEIAHGHLRLRAVQVLPQMDTDKVQRICVNPRPSVSHFRGICT